MNSLAFCGITKRFQSVCALDAVDLPMRATQAVLLAGPNGAGKTTLINILLGLYPPDQGAIEIDGHSARIDKTVKARMGYLPENVAFSENLSGWTMMKFYGRARGVGKIRMQDVMERIGLSRHARRSIGGYSKGMRQRLALGIAILHEPELLILDEPTSGLDQEGLRVLWTVVEEWRAKGRMTLISSHDLGILEKRVDVLCVLRKGEVLACDTPRAIRSQADLPVRVEFVLCPDTSAAVDLTAILRRHGIGDPTQVDPLRLRVEAAPGRIVELMHAVFTGYGHPIQSMQISEPELEDIYEHLLEGP